MIRSDSGELTTSARSSRSRSVLLALCLHRRADYWLSGYGPTRQTMPPATGRQGGASNVGSGLGVQRSESARGMAHRTCLARDARARHATATVICDMLALPVIVILLTKRSCRVPGVFCIPVACLVAWGASGVRTSNSGQDRAEGWLLWRGQEFGTANTRRSRQSMYELPVGSDASEDQEAV